MYIKINALVIIRVSGGSWIPVDVENRDYQQYLVWLSSQTMDQL